MIIIELYNKDGTIVIFGKKRLNNIAREIYGKVRTVLIIQKDDICDIILSDFKGKSIIKFKIFKKYSDYSFLEDFNELCVKSIQNYVINKEYKDVYDVEFNNYQEWKNGMKNYE